MTAVSPGYNPGGGSVPLAATAPGGVVANLESGADQIACAAPGYILSQDGLDRRTSTRAVLPAGWSVTNDSTDGGEPLDGPEWRRSHCGYVADNRTGGDGAYAIQRIATLLGAIVRRYLPDHAFGRPLRLFPVRSSDSTPTSSAVVSSPATLRTWTSARMAAPRGPTSTTGLPSRAGRGWSRSTSQASRRVSPTCGPVFTTASTTSSVALVASGQHPGRPCVLHARSRRARRRQRPRCEHGRRVRTERPS